MLRRLIALGVVIGIAASVAPGAIASECMRPGASQTASASPGTMDSVTSVPVSRSQGSAQLIAFAREARDNES